MLVLGAGCWAGVGRARSAQVGVRGRAGEGAGGRWGAQAAGACRRWGARVARGRQARERWQARGRAGGLGARQGAAAGAGARGARVAELAGRAAWARGLALGCALGALGLFLDPVRLGIFLSHQMNIVHYKIKFFSKKKIIFIKFK